MNIEFIDAIKQLAKEKNIPENMLFDSVEEAFAAAYKRELLNNYDGKNKDAITVRAELDRKTGDCVVLQVKDVVADEDFVSELSQIPLSEAKEIDEEYEIGDEIEYMSDPKEFSRVMAQNVKNKLIQSIREIERRMVYEEFVDKIGEIVNGVVQRKVRDTYFVSLGSTEDGVLTQKEQVPGERIHLGQRIKVYIMDVRDGSKEETRQSQNGRKNRKQNGPQIYLSRSHPGLVKRLFEMEVPEIQNGIVTITGIAREAGSRTKMAVSTIDPNVDPVGACVGTRGARVQAVVDELSGEKIDIIPWSENPVQLIANVLSPSDVESVVIESEEDKIATAIVPDNQLSLAIGKQGQNVRLAARVSGWKIDIKSHTQYYTAGEETDIEPEDQE
ncbi:MAG: transcription termination/antitermination protein NusA [Eubacterium sp.]|nr:transcription termination/antitermination protein NusA [Eubacterium sp.]